mmetsp:Transcript_10140/g.30402  ORF Transcript_10140/g.30402 Transcript_10140/m.30402 type:complete len:294 (+) Transcript_10140:95-976(+)
MWPPGRRHTPRQRAVVLGWPPAPPTPLYCWPGARTRRPPPLPWRPALPSSQLSCSSLAGQHLAGNRSVAGWLLRLCVLPSSQPATPASRALHPRPWGRCWGRLPPRGVRWRSWGLCRRRCTPPRCRPHWRRRGPCSPSPGSCWRRLWSWMREVPVGPARRALRPGSPPATGASWQQWRLWFRWRPSQHSTAFRPSWLTRVHHFQQPPLQPFCHRRLQSAPQPSHHHPRSRVLRLRPPSSSCGRRCSSCGRSSRRSRPAPPPMQAPCSKPRLRRRPPCGGRRQLRRRWPTCSAA